MQRKRISIATNTYKHTYGLHHGTIDRPFYETLDNIKALLKDGIKVNEHVGDKVVELTLENFDKDNSTSEDAEEEEPVVVKTVELFLTNPTIKEGATTTTTVNILPAEADDKTVTYSSEKQEIATVDVNTGLVTGVKAGTTNIIATARNGVTGKATVTVERVPVPVQSIQVSLTDDNIMVDETTNASVIVLPAEADDKTVTYSSEKQEIATVDVNTGLVTGVKAGTTNIIATAKNGVTGKVALTVSPKPVQVTKVNLSLVKNTLNINETTTCQVTTEPEGAVGTTITYSSENEQVATVNSSTGEVTAKSQGSTNIIATSENGTQGKASINVNEAQELEVQ